METLYELYYRSKMSQPDYRALVGPVLESDTLALLTQLYKWLKVSPQDIDDAKYLLLKKFSEVCYSPSP